MKKSFSSVMVVFVQLFIAGFFFYNSLANNIKLDENVNTIKNDNLNKIADSVSVLFDLEPIDIGSKIQDNSIFELPSIDAPVVVTEEEKTEKKEIVSTPLTSVEASKYNDNLDMGFKVTEGNKTYSLGEYEFNVVVAVVAGEFDKVQDDALGVMSVILNRCDNTTWRAWAGNSPYLQVIKAGQFEVYFAGYYLAYMPGGSQYGGAKYNMAKQAVLDGLNGIRNNEYLGFRAWHVSSYSDKYIVSGGNRYGFN